MTINHRFTVKFQISKQTPCELFWNFKPFLSIIHAFFFRGEGIFKTAPFELFDGIVCGSYRAAGSCSLHVGWEGQGGGGGEGAFGQAR